MAGRYDVIDCQCISPTTLGAVAAARLRGKPVLLRPSLGGQEGEIATMLGKDVARLMRRILDGVDLFPVLDHAIAADLANIGIPRDRCRPVRNGVDLLRFQVPGVNQKEEARRAYGFGEGPVALFAGQLISRKGLPDLLEVWPKVRQALPAAELVIVGAGPLQSQVDALADHGVHCFGVRDDLHRLMQAADLFVMPSKNESFGCAYAEAMACGLPLIAGDTGIAQELAIDGRAGYQVSHGDIVTLQARLIELLTSPARRAAMGAEAAALVRVFDMEQVAAEIVGLYRETIRLAGDRRGQYH
jgi:phosphatidylinositol alpha-1,6-mannosyltransferase